MKTIPTTVAIIVILALYALPTHAQISLIGKGKETVKETLIHLDYDLVRDTVIAKKDDRIVSTLVYIPKGNDTTQHFTRTFFLLNNKCVGLLMEAYLKYLPEMIGAINTEYSRIDQTHWVSKNAYYKITLEMKEEDFSLYFERM